MSCLKKPVLLAVSGWKHTGKTTLIDKLLPLLNEKGLKVAVIKHDGHDFEPDVPGTDSYRHFQNGAYGTAVFSSGKFSVVKTVDNPGLDMIKNFFPEADLILCEGFKNTDIPKLVMVGGHRFPQVLGTVMAYITDDPAQADPHKNSTIPVIYRNSVDEIMNIIIRYYQTHN